MTLRIPGCDAAGAPLPQADEDGAGPIEEPPIMIEDRVDEALVTTAPDGWQQRPSIVPEAVAYESARGSVVFQQYVEETPDDVIDQAIADGGVLVELPDGARAVFTDPSPAAADLLVPLPGLRLLRINNASPDGEPTGGPDYLLDVLRPWMADLRAALR